MVAEDECVWALVWAGLNDWSVGESERSGEGVCDAVVCHVETDVSVCMVMGCSVGK